MIRKRRKGLLGTIQDNEDEIDDEEITEGGEGDEERKSGDFVGGNGNGEENIEEGEGDEGGEGEDFDEQ